LLCQTCISSPQSLSPVIPSCLFVLLLFVHSPSLFSLLYSLSTWLILIDWQGLIRSVLPLRSREFSPLRSILIWMAGTIEVDTL
jgi:ABC-type sulfate transport system permease subunit